MRYEVRSRPGGWLNIPELVGAWELVMIGDAIAQGDNAMSPVSLCTHFSRDLLEDLAFMLNKAHEERLKEKP